MRQNIFIAIFTLIISSSAFAQEGHEHHNMDHSMHMQSQDMKPKKDQYSSNTGTTVQYAELEQYPESGEARELGFDDSMFMESTSVHNDMATMCAHAARGLIILDRTTWNKCGMRPKGLIDPNQSSDVNHHKHH